VIPNDMAIRKTIATDDRHSMDVMNKPQLLLILSLLATSGPRLHAAPEQVHVPTGLVGVVNDRLTLASDIREKAIAAGGLLCRPDHGVDGTLSFGCFTWAGCAAMLLAAALAQTKMR